MNVVAASLAAQLDAETRMRLRSGATVIAVLAMFAIAFAYIPDPSANRVSISWERNGLLMSGYYSSAYIGWVVAMLTSIFLPFVGFFLVTGSIRRDLERRIWPIIAATPTPRIAYLGGKLLSNFAYLMLLGAVSLVPATLLFFIYGHGAFEPFEIVKPWLLLVPPSMLFTAAMALLFDATPGLRGRGGYVIWFFAWTFLFFAIPTFLSGVFDNKAPAEQSTPFDPVGIVLVGKAVQNAIGGAPESLNLGISIISKPLHRVEFPGVPLTAAIVARRAGECLWSFAVLGLASLTFSLGTGKFAHAKSTPSAKAGVKNEFLADERTTAMPALPLARETHPSFFRSVIADALLIWQSASWLKWPMAATTLIIFFLPASASGGGVAVVLILTAVVISEAAAREELSGTSALVYAQPGVPRSIVAWKSASVALFVSIALSSTIVHAALTSADRLASIVLCVIFVVSSSVGLGLLTGGGKFFSALFTAAWYVAVQGQLDFTGAFAKAPDASIAAAFATAGLLSLGAAWARERYLSR